MIENGLDRGADRHATGRWSRQVCRAVDAWPRRSPDPRAAETLRSPLAHGFHLRSGSVL